MPIQKSETCTDMINRDLGYMFSVPVFYTDELVETSVYELAFSSVHGAYLPYLFTGYFTGDNKFHRWYFANARRHEELREVVEKDLRRNLNCVFGQIHFNAIAMKQGELHFERLMIHEYLPDRARAEKLLREVIKPEYLDWDFEIRKVRW